MRLIMRGWRVGLLGLLLGLSLGGAARAADPKDMVTYAGGVGPQEFVNVFQLSDGTVLVSGNARDLNWIPVEVPRVNLDPGIINSRGGGRVAYLLHLSADLARMLRVVALPKDLVSHIMHIRTNTLPGEKTGDLYISGPRANGNPALDGGDLGYFLGKLNGNFVDQVPTGFTWVRNVAAKSTLLSRQPWDVTRDGRVYFAAGEPFGNNEDSWSAIYRLTPAGKYDKVENWRYHLTTKGSSWWGQGASQRPDIEYSAISLGTRGRGSLRSWDMGDYLAKQPDGNGGNRQGRWPLDAFFAGPFDPARPGAGNAGPGYTGYRLGPVQTCEVGAIEVDRRTGNLYFGLAIQSRLSNDKLDVEPAVVAMNDQGSLLWWSRLYTEGKDNSPAQQFVAALAIDYSQPADKGSLVVLARVHGNQPNNLWRGDQVAAADAPKRGFQSFFDGAAGDVFIGWLGRLTLDYGTLRAATYVGEYAEGLRTWNQQFSYTDPRLDGWLDHDKNFGDLGMTPVRPLVEIDGQGRVYVLASGRRVVTTANAYQKMLKPDQGLSAYAEFVRVYKPDLTSLIYSSLLTGKWNPADGTGGNNTALTGLQIVPGGVLIAGFQTVDAQGIIEGNPVPVRNVPAWGRKEPAGEEALLAKFHFE